MPSEHVGELLGRYNKSLTEHNEPEGDESGEKPPVGKDKGHTFHVHKHKDGTHHLSVHGEHGQLVYHSEHPSLEEAADAMKQHGHGGEE
jgi:hypothetical protein